MGDTGRTVSHWINRVSQLRAPSYIPAISFFYQKVERGVGRQSVKERCSLAALRGVRVRELSNEALPRVA